MPIGTPEFVDAFVRSKADDIQQDVQKLRIIQDPKIHYDLLRFCQHTRIAFLARNVPPDVMMKHTDGNPAAAILVQDAIVLAILQRGLGDTYNTLPQHVLEWCRTIVELPHHEGGLAITPLQASGMAAFYSANANLVAWLQSLPHASEWVAGQTLSDPNTWTSSALHTLKHLHEQLMQHYNCKEWAPPPNVNAPAHGVPDPDLDDNARPLSLPPLNLIASLRVRQDEENGDADARPSCCPRNVGSPNRSCKSGADTKLLSAIRPPTACVMYTSCISPNLCPCSTRTQHFAPICRSVTTTRAGSPSVSPSHLPRPCGARWGALGLQAIAMRAQLSSSRRRIMLLSSISFSGSPTILYSLLLQMCHADAKGTLWVVRVHGTTSIHALLILPIGLERTITS